jgi:hypothetical protein
MPIEDAYDTAWITYNHKSRDSYRKSCTTVYDVPSEFFTKYIDEIGSKLSHNYINGLRIFKYDRGGQEGHDKDVYIRRYFLSYRQMKELIKRIENEEELTFWLLERLHDINWRCHMIEKVRYLVSKKKLGRDEAEKYLDKTDGDLLKALALIMEDRVDKLWDCHIN